MGVGQGQIRPRVTPFVVRPPAGRRIRTRLRVSAADERILRELGKYLSQLANSDLAARCRAGTGDTNRARRKRDLTRRSSSRWAGAITRTSNDQWESAYRNLTADISKLRQSTRIIEQRLRAPVGDRKRSVRGYSTQAERWNKQRRLQALNHRLAEAEKCLKTGRVSVVRGGRRLARVRHNLQAAALSESQWRRIWEARRSFLCADGEADKAWGNETIRVHPDEHWLEVKLPPDLLHFANRPHGRYRLSCPAVFSYQLSEWRAQIESGAVRYDIFYSPGRNRWYVDASWTYSPRLLPSVDDATARGVVAVDLNSGHLACWIVDSDGNPLGSPQSISYGPPSASSGSSTLDGHIRSAVSEIISLARSRGCQAIAIENLNFDDLRAGGHDKNGRGWRGKQRRRMIAGMPTRRFRDRLVQMCANQGLWVVAVDPAYTSRWGREHWRKPLQERTRTAVSVHHAAAVVIGRRAIGHGARRRPHVTAGDRRIAHAESRGSGQAWTGRVQEPDLPNADSAARRRRIRQTPAKGADQGLGRPRPFGAAQRKLDSRAR
jgi:IS605 OrfB family transposase